MQQGFSWNNAPRFLVWNVLRWLEPPIHSTGTFRLHYAHHELSLRILNKSWRHHIDNYIAYWQRHWPKELLFKDRELRINNMLFNDEKLNDHVHALQSDDVRGLDYATMVFICFAHKRLERLRKERKWDDALEWRRDYRKRVSNVKLRLARPEYESESTLDRLHWTLRSYERSVRKYDELLKKNYDNDIQYIKKWIQRTERPYRKERQKRRQKQKRVSKKRIKKWKR